MAWSWKLVRIAGIDIYVHVTFFVLIAWLGMSHWQESGTIASVVNGVGFVLALFVCIVLHEYGHALTARRYGITTRHITLLPIGGVASLDRMPEDPRQEIHVALAGPAVNLVIALGLYFWLWAQSALVPVDQLAVTEGPMLERLMVVNVFIAIFNLLPAFPMDGGRVLRALLAMQMPHVQATRRAANIGQALAFWFVLLGLLYNPFLILIAVFVWIGAEAEASAVQVRSTLEGVTVSEAMLTDFQVLSPRDTLKRAIEETLSGTQKDFPVLENGKVVGVLTQEGLLGGLQKQGDQGLVGEAMANSVRSVDISEPVGPLLEKLQSGECRIVPVMQSGRLKGIVDLDNISELLRIQGAIQNHNALQRRR